jgi:hypothetical protein
MIGSMGFSMLGSMDFGLAIEHVIAHAPEHAYAHATAHAYAHATSHHVPYDLSLLPIHLFANTAGIVWCCVVATNITLIKERWVTELGRIVRVGLQPAKVCRPSDET